VPQPTRETAEPALSAESSLIRHEFAQVPSSLPDAEVGPSLAGSLGALIAVVLVVAWLLSWKFGLALLVLFVLMLVLERRGPRRAKAIASQARSAQHRIGRGLQRGALGMAWALAVLPISLFRGNRGGPHLGWTDRVAPGKQPLQRQYSTADHLSRRRPARGRGALVALGLITALFAVDLGLGTVTSAMRDGDRPLDARARASAYDDSPWAPDYWTDFRGASVFDYQPFVGWRRADYSSDFVNIEDGLRATWAPPADDNALTIWVFGGSTTWGTGQRDDHTIASHLARLATEAAIPVQVTNFGESGYVLWQEVQMLQAELIEGRTPDIAIFYDGVNEPTAHGDEVITAPTHARAEVFELRLERQPNTGVVDEIRARSFMLKVARSVRNRLSPPAESAAQEVIKTVPPELAIENMMAIYAEGLLSGRDLAERHQFEVVHFWQPNIYTKRYLPAEDDAWDVIRYATWDDEWYQAVFDEARERLPEGVVDLSDALDSVDTPVMIDPVHTNELGAQLVAERIFDEIESTLTQLHATTRAGS